jgi:poly-gamma-glutamate capsule biosynthesis protein CapA/YwtB (metallophosphatase superfamily)
MSRFTLLATGDVAPRRDDLASMFAKVTRALGAGDIVFGQLETTLSARGTPAPNARLAMRAPPEAAKAIAAAGYDVVSFAGNHAMDFGPDAFFDTLQHAREAGLAVCGAGPDIAAARRPALLNAGGATLAILAYSSILPQGYWAEEHRPGCAPMRAITAYEPIEPDQPGTPARVHTFPHRADLAALRADVRAAKEMADVVLVSIHWGIHFVPAEIADYQRDVSYAAIDDGADAILGHHPHILKGVEIHKGRPIFYSLGNFAIEQPQAFDPTILQSQSFKDLMALNPGIDPMKAFVCPPDSKKTMIARLTFEDARLARAAFQPAWIDDDSTPEALAPDDARFADVVRYMAEISESQRLGVRYCIDGPDVVIEPAG